MCNAKPGRRCAGPDTQKPIIAHAEMAEILAKKLDTETNRDKRDVLRELIIEERHSLADAKVAYYASAKAQKDFPAALRTIETLTGGQGTINLEREEILFQAGGNLRELQTKADKMRKNGASQLTVARYFNQGGVLIETGKMRDAIMENAPEPEDASYDLHVHKLKALEIASDAMWKDCGEVVGADMKKNSAEYESPAAKLSIRKRPAGQFAISSEFNVKANSPEEAATNAAKRFDSDTVLVTGKLSEEKQGEYRVVAKYSYKGGEKLVDALIYHNKIYKGNS